MAKRKKRLKAIEIPCPIVGCRAYLFGDRLKVIVGLEPHHIRPEYRWHLSISHPDRYPTWDEIKAARYRFVPKEITMAMLLPPPDEYVNIDSNCFHLHQLHPEDEESFTGTDSSFPAGEKGEESHHGSTARRFGHSQNPPANGEPIIPATLGTSEAAKKALDAGSRRCSDAGGKAEVRPG